MKWEKDIKTAGLARETLRPYYGGRRNAEVTEVIGSYGSLGSMQDDVLEASQ